MGDRGVVKRKRYHWLEMGLQNQVQLRHINLEVQGMACGKKVFTTT